MKLAVIGSRNFTDYNLLKRELDALNNITEVVSGAAKGTDELAKKYALENNITLVEFPADYKTYGHKAPHIRNDQIIKYSDKLIAFWDGQSKGTQSVFRKADKKGKLLKVIPFVEDLESFVNRITPQNMHDEIQDDNSEWLNLPE